LTFALRNVSNTGSLGSQLGRGDAEYP